MWQRTAIQQGADIVFPGNPGGESGSAVLCSTALPMFSGRHRGNPVPTPGLTAGRVNGEKNTRTASLRRWPGDGFFGQNTEVGVPTLVREQSRNPDLGVEQSRNPDLGLRGLGGLAWPRGRWCGRGGGFNARQVARPGGFYARQVAGMWRARYRSHVGQAIKQGWASQCSESLGVPVLIGRTRTQSRWARCACSARQKCPLGYTAHATCTVACHLNSGCTTCHLYSGRRFHSGPLPRRLYSGRHFHSGPQRLCACSAHLPTLCLCLLSACTYKCLLGTVPAWHVLVPAPCSARLPRCPLGTAPPPAHRREVLRDVHLTGKKGGGVRGRGIRA